MEALPNYTSRMISILKYIPKRDRGTNTEIEKRTNFKKKIFWSVGGIYR